MSKNEVLKLLFDPGEGVCLGDNAKAYRVTTLEEALKIPSAELICVNPLDKEKDNAPPKKDWHRPDLPRRDDMNVTAYRNFVFEFDKGTLQEQMDILDSRKVPYSVLTYSGGKSLHAVIALSESLSNINEYKETFHTVRKVLWMTDDSCVNPSRLTRLAGSIRADTGKEQELLDIRRRISKYELTRWLSKFRKHIERITKQEEEAREQRMKEIAERQREGVGGIKLLSNNERDFLNGKHESTNSRHKRLVAITYRLLEFGVPYEQAQAIITTAFINLGIGRDIREAEEIVDHVYS